MIRAGIEIHSTNDEDGADFKEQMSLTAAAGVFTNYTRQLKSGIPTDLPVHFSFSYEKEHVEVAVH